MRQKPPNLCKPIHFLAKKPFKFNANNQNSLKNLETMQISSPSAHCHEEPYLYDVYQEKHLHNSNNTDRTQAMPMTLQVLKPNLCEALLPLPAIVGNHHADPDTL